MTQTLENPDFDSLCWDAYEMLYSESAFYDITLVCEDNRRIPAHKVIIATASNVFKHMIDQRYL